MKIRTPHKDVGEKTDNIRQLATRCSLRPSRIARFFGGEGGGDLGKGILRVLKISLKHLWTLQVLRGPGKVLLTINCASSKGERKNSETFDESNVYI